jgi:hypothetical protein
MANSELRMERLEANEGSGGEWRTKIPADPEQGE